MGYGVDFVYILKAVKQHRLLSSCSVACKIPRSTLTRVLEEYGPEFRYSQMRLLIAFYNTYVIGPQNLRLGRESKYLF